MSTLIKTLRDDEGNIVLPRTTTQAVTLGDGTTTVDEGLNSKAPLIHTHSINEVVNLQNGLNIINEEILDLNDKSITLVDEIPTEPLPRVADLLGVTSESDILTALDGKANKVQEAWITPTLLNGWTGTLKYRKNNFGQLEFWADLIAGVGTFDTEIFTFPSTYRTGLFMTMIRAYNANAGATPCDLRINLTGKLTPVSTITTGHRILFNAVIQIS